VGTHLRVRASRTVAVAEVMAVARYEFRDGKSVVIEPIPNATEQPVQAWLRSALASIIAAQQGNFALHGNVIEIDGERIIVTGDRGTGKSTSTIAAMLAGAVLITDDVTVMSVEDGDGSGEGPTITHVPFDHPCPRRWVCGSRSGDARGSCDRSPVASAWRSVAAGVGGGQGWQVLADSVAPIRGNSGGGDTDGIEIMPTTDDLHLWPVSMPSLGLDPRDGVALRPGIGNLAVTLERVNDASVALSTIVVLRRSRSNTSGLQSLSSVDTIGAVDRLMWHAAAAKALLGPAALFA
jgi:hypothetical protein